MDVADRDAVAEPEVEPVLAVPRGPRLQPILERVHAPVIQDGVHDTPPALPAELQTGRMPLRVQTQAGIGTHLAELS